MAADSVPLPEATVTLLSTDLVGSTLLILRRLGRDLGMAGGAAVTTLAYAAVHVIRRHGSRGPVGVCSGVAQAVGLFSPLAEGTALPQLFGLVLLGALLAAARLRAGTLWLAIGLHAAFVAGFRVRRLFFVIHPTPAWLVGTSPAVCSSAGVNKHIFP